MGKDRSKDEGNKLLEDQFVELLQRKQTDWAHILFV